MPVSPFPPIPELVITTHGIQKLLENQIVTKATGPDNIPAFILKNCAPILAPLLQSIFTQSIITGSLPDDMLCANISPCFKAGDRTDPSNYRPISLTSIICKILEHIVHKHIMNHLDRHSILTDAQHGFRQQRSCETQLITTYHDILTQLDDQNVQKVDAVVLDFAKAFDKVPHKRLAIKLKFYGITGPILDWITAFLSNRTQRVLLDGSSSNPVPVTSGVPQGTVLGPLLFILYINDLPDITVESKVRLFADDSLIYKAIKSANDSRDLQNDLDALGRWSEKWLMIFRPDKCKLLSFTRSHSPTDFQYTLNNVNIQATDTHKYLGVHLSSDTKFNAHIDKIYHKANQKLGFLRRNLHSCTREIKHVAYDSLVRPGMEYCAGVWDPHNKTCINKLESVNTKAARFITNNHSREEGTTSQIKSQINMDLLSTRRKSQRLTIMYKIANNHIKMNKDGILTPASNKYKYNLRKQHSVKYITLGGSTKIYNKSYFPRTIHDWNSLPQETIDCKSVDSFKHKMLAHIQRPNTNSHT